MCERGWWSWIWWRCLIRASLSVCQTAVWMSLAMRKIQGDAIKMVTMNLLDCPKEWNFFHKSFRANWCGVRECVCVLIHQNVWLVHFYSTLFKIQFYNQTKLLYMDGYMSRIYIYIKQNKLLYTFADMSCDRFQHSTENGGAHMQ